MWTSWLFFSANVANLTSSSWFRAYTYKCLIFTSGWRSAKGFFGGSAGKESACSAGDKGDADSFPRLGRSPGGGNSSTLQCSFMRLGTQGVRTKLNSSFSLNLIGITGYILLCYLFTEVLFLLEPATYPNCLIVGFPTSASNICLLLLFTHEVVSASLQLHGL